jgi:protein-tyrosine phosphatase
MIVDFHNHVLPAIDDGARDAGESRSAVLAMREAGVRVVIVSPHVAASTLGTAEAAEYSARIGAALTDVRKIAAAEVPDMVIERGAEILLDIPEPLLDRSLSLAGGDFVLVEFSLFGVPPGAADILFRLRAQGWRPILGHPERYTGLSLRVLQSWHASGALLQVNAGSLLGDYGPEARGRAWDLLRLGIADYLCGDFHARGKYRVPAALEALSRRKGRRQKEELIANGVRLGRGESPEPVPPLTGGGWLSTIFTRN